ncbi:MAG: exo-alpha-sialidase [Sphingobacteriales bacterium]|nr:exo-alpha-sialidase [Sphingobacteriales bacterium]OJV99485.1 MAG: hypothetical protein BGO52_12585 [Sphingobacteriales bacterium 44-61]
MNRTGVNNSLLYIGCIILLCSCACGKKVFQGTDSPDNKTTEIKVGSRTITTDKFTKKGTPVVPMWKAPMATVDLRHGAGFPVLNSAEHTVVWAPAMKEEGAYNHYACLINYKGTFYAMWGNHPLGEDAPGQRVLFSTSTAWGQWSQPKELFAAPGPVLPRSEDGIHLKPDRWAIIDDELYAVVFVHGAGRYPIARKVGPDGTLGDPFLVEALPANGSLPVYMQGQDLNVLKPLAAKITDWYVKNDQISWWADAAKGVPRKAIDGSSLIESFMYRTKEDEQVVMLRNWGTPSNPVHNNRMYVSFKKGSGGWATPYPTDIPDAPSRAQAIRLEDGRILLIGSQNVTHFDAALYLDRDPITISISKNGYVFDKVYALRTGSPSTFRFQGVGGRNPGYAYSSSVVHNGFLYTLYSIGKEDMAISRVSLSELK